MSNKTFHILLLTIFSASGTSAPAQAPYQPAQDQAEQVLAAGRSAMQARRPSQSLPCFQKYVKLKPEDPRGYFWLGMALDELGDLKGALSAYTDSLEQGKKLGMDSEELRVNLGNTLMKLNYLKEATFDYKRALEINPKNAIAHMNLGRALIESNEYQAAYLQFKAVSDLGVTSPELSYFKAQALKGMGKKEEARRQLQSVSVDEHADETVKQAARQLLEKD